MNDKENKPYSQELIESLRRFEILKNHCLIGEFPIEEFDNKLQEARKMTKEEFNKKYKI